MRCWADDQLAALTPRFPKWDLWYVPLYPTGYGWSAKPKGARIATIHADTPESLAAQIQQQETP